MSEKKRLTVREFFHYVNCEEKDVDVCVDGVNAIAVCGGDIGLTPAGMEKFQSVLDMEMDGNCIVGNDKDYEDLDAYEYDEGGDGGRLQLAWELLAGLAGYCSCDDYDKWFTEDEENAF